ncbi:MAG: hypothetical protein IH800_17495, partial [Myxococcales bacterium]|nr:hypothetical protein [Myxococcales bacterium]
LQEYGNAVQTREFNVEWVLFHSVPVRHNGIQKSAELNLGFARQIIPIARLLHGPTVRERKRVPSPSMKGST